MSSASSRSLPSMRARTKPALRRSAATQADGLARRMERLRLAQSIEEGAFPGVPPAERALVHRRLDGDPAHVRALRAVAALADAADPAGALRVDDDLAWSLPPQAATLRVALAPEAHSQRTRSELARSGSDVEPCDARVSGPVELDRGYRRRLLVEVETRRSENNGQRDSRAMLRHGNAQCSRWQSCDAFAGCASLGIGRDRHNGEGHQYRGGFPDDGLLWALYRRKAVHRSCW